MQYLDFGDLLTISQHIHYLIDTYVNYYGYCPNIIYLDKEWIDQYSFNKKWLDISNFEEENNIYKFPCLYDIPIKVMTDGWKYWYKQDIKDLLNLDPFIYIGNFVMTEHTCFDTIKRIKLFLKHQKYLMDLKISSVD